MVLPQPQHFINVKKYTFKKKKCQKLTINTRKTTVIFMLVLMLLDILSKKTYHGNIDYRQTDIQIHSTQWFVLVTPSQTTLKTEPETEEN